MKTIAGAIWAINCCPRPVGNWPCLFTPLPLCLSLYLFSLVDFSLFPALPLPVPDNFPQMAHQKRFIERKYRQELKEMRRERERQEKETDETEECRKWQRPFFFCFWRGVQSGSASTLRSSVCRCGSHPGKSWLNRDATRWLWSCDSLAMTIDCSLSSTWTSTDTGEDCSGFYDS